MANEPNMFDRIDQYVNNPEVKAGLLKAGIHWGQFGNVNTSGMEKELADLQSGQAMSQLNEALIGTQKKWESGDNEGALADLDNHINTLAKNPYMRPEALKAVLQLRMEKGQEFTQDKRDRDWIESLTGNEAPLDLIKSGIKGQVKPETLKLIQQNKKAGYEFVHDAKLGLVGWQNPATQQFIPMPGYMKPEDDDAIKPTAEQDAWAVNLYGQGMKQLKKDAIEGKPLAQEALGAILTQSKSHNDPVLQRKDIEKYLDDRGWKKEDADYSKQYLSLARAYQMAPGGGLMGLGEVTIPFGPNYKPKSGAAIPPPPAARTGAGLPPVAPLGGGATPGTGGLMAERLPSPEQTDQYVDKETGTPAPSGMTLTQIEQSGKYAKLPIQVINKFGTIRTARAALDSIEDVIERRKDLFPDLTGDNKKDAKAVSAARLKFKALAGDGVISQFSPWKGTDPDIGRFLSNLSALPTFARGMGDVGNIATKEQEIHAAAVGMTGGSGRQDALARIDNIRQLYNSGLEGLGVRGLFNRRPKSDTEIQRAPERKTKSGLSY